MKTHLQSSIRIFAAACASIAVAVAPSYAATMSASSTAPAINDDDIANYGVVSGTDKWFTGTDGAARGQSITTGGAAVRVKAISYQVSQGNGATPTKTYALRVGKMQGNNFTQVHSETATQNFSWTSGQFMTWTFDTPVLLEPFTTYGIDVGMLTSTSGYQTGIPYINLTADEYSGGTSYTSGTSGVGTDSISSAINTDRIFHLDIDRPLGPVFSLVAPSPADNATHAFASREIVMTFTQNVTPGTGNLTIRNLTDNTETSLDTNDSRLTYDQNVVRINPAGLLTWNKNYAIRFDEGMFLGDGGSPITAIIDDTTWNFTTIAADPLLAAIAALKAHILNTTPLMGSQISAHKTTIDDNRQRFAENTEIINAVFDLITTYDTAKGPLFVSGFLNNSTSFDRTVTSSTNKNSVSPENYHWVIYTIMQHAMDLIYTGENLAKYEATLATYKFGSHTSFPGSCSPPLDPLNTHTVSINGSFPATFGRLTQDWTKPARKPTGTYLAPGTVATVTVPPALVNAGYKIRVGAHSWDLSARRPVNRLERASRLYSINSTSVKVASPYGGGIYIEVPYLANAGVVSVTVTGGVRSPYFSAKSFHQMTATDWDIEKTHPAPWADFQSEKFMIQVPRKWIYNMTGAQAVKLMVDWDKAMDAINDLMGFPRNRGKETMYCQTDVILRSSVHAPGYPAVNVTSNVNSEVDPLGYAGNYLVRGPSANPPASNIEFHEQGHAYGFPKFGGESESTVNLLQPAMLNRAFGVNFDVAHAASLGSTSSARTIDNTAIAWMTVFNFSPRKVPMADGEKSYQHKGHAKFMDVARLFGWDKLDTFWRTYMQDGATSESTDDLMLRLCKAVGADIRPLFHFWGIHPENPSALATAIAAANPPIPSSNVIRLELLRYKDLVPANNADFQSFARAWWGKQPSINGYWEEREHARQWDTAALYGVGDQQRSEATNPGEIYNQNSANDIRNRIDELIALYYPGAITPNPMTFAIAPSVVNSTTIGMVATTATAGIGPIEYFFDETSGNPGGTDSAWQTSPVYQDSGLTPGLTYTYTVSARGGPFGQPTDPSAALNATPISAGDVTSPAPSPMTFATPPKTVDEQTITMTASTATDINDVEYYFVNITNNINSGWQDSPVYTETNLQPVTEYTYQVRARDKSANQNLTAFSATASANTGNLPDVLPPQSVSFSPADASIVSNLAANLIVTFDEPVLRSSGSVTLKNLTDASETVFAMSDPAITVSGSTLTLNPPADLLYEKTYAVQITGGAVADVSNNPFIGINDDGTWSFTTILANPIPNSGGPYIVPVGSSLTLIGSAIPSTGASVNPSGYAWDMNRDNVFGEVTGANPASMTDVFLMSTYGMVLGQNAIKLRVTDSLGNSTTVTTIVKIDVNLNWDSNVNSANQQDGAGTWLSANQWRDNGVNTSWISGSTAVFGVNGNGGNVTLGANTTAGALLFNAFNGTYSLIGGGILTVNNGFTNNSTSGAVTFTTPLMLGGPQTWGGTSTGALTFNGGINTNGHTLTIGVPGTTTISAGASVITGGGGLTKNGSGRLILGGGSPVPAHDYSGATTLNGGVTMVSNFNIGSGNLTLNGAVIESYWSTNFTRALGSGSGQMQITGGESGFSCNGNTGLNVIIGNNASLAANDAIWGSAFFNPSVLVFQSTASQGNSSVTFQNRIDLNGANRTIQVFSGASGTASATISGVIRTGTGTAGLIKTGSGRLNLNAANTYNGGTTVAAGTLQLGNAAALGAINGPLTVNAGLLNLNDQTITIGNLSGTGGTIANNASNARTLTIGSGNNGGGIYQGVIANRTNTGTGTLALTKTGSDTITLAGHNTYTGATIINGGGTLVLTGASQATTAITFAGDSKLGLVIGSHVTAASAAVNFANGRVSVTGSPSSPSHTLLTALSFNGTPQLATPIPGYQLEVVGTQLQLNAVVTDPYTAWSGGAAFGTDSNGDGVQNGVAWVLGAANVNLPANGLLPSIDSTTEPDYLIFTYRRKDEAHTDANTTIKVEYGSDLLGWTEAVAGEHIIIAVTENVAPGIDSVKVKIHRSLATGEKLFAHLKVSKSP